jgi:antitoxin YefM
MTHVNLSEFRANMAKHLDRLEADRDHIVLTRQDHEPVVIVTQSEWEGMKETIHMLSSRANAERLMRAVNSFKASDDAVLGPEDFVQGAPLK